MTKNEPLITEKPEISVLMRQKPSDITLWHWALFVGTSLACDGMEGPEDPKFVDKYDKLAKLCGDMGLVESRPEVSDGLHLTDVGAMVLALLASAAGMPIEDVDSDDS